MAWPAVNVSQETRLSFPSRCSTTTRIESGISSGLRFSVLSSQFSVRSELDENHGERACFVCALLPADSGTLTRLHCFKSRALRFSVCRLVSWRSPLRRLRESQSFLFSAECTGARSSAGCCRPRIGFPRESLCASACSFLLDADERRVTKLVDAGLNREHCGQR